MADIQKADDIKCERCGTGGWLPVGMHRVKTSLKNQYGSFLQIKYLTKAIASLHI